MSTVLRMKKDLGFRQLLIRIETCASAERERVLQSLTQDDPGLAAILKTKSLNLDRVLSWEPKLLANLFVGLPPRTLACLFALAPQKMTTATSALAQNFVANIHALECTNPITDDEKDAARIHLFSHLREQERLGHFQLEEIDPVLATRMANAA